MPPEATTQAEVSRPAGLTEPKLVQLEVCAINDRFQACVTTSLVDGSAPKESKSPIDQFIATTKLLNVLSRSRGPAATTIAEADESLAEDQIADLLAIAEEVEPTSDTSSNPIAVSEIPAAGYAQSSDSSASTAQPETPGAELGVEQKLEVPHGILGAEADLQASAMPPQQQPPNISAAAVEEAEQNAAPPENVPSIAEIDFQLNGLVLLGFISSVESYLRNLTTRLVFADEFVEKRAEDQKLTYGAARYHSKELLAEAFLEEMTLISKEHVETLLRSVMGVEFFGDRFKLYINEYDRICQLRHCIVHRFGKLGSKNAIKLGLKQHNELIEKPIRISADELQNISLNLLNLVQVINNLVYDFTMRRQAQQSAAWKWSFEADKARFESLYSIFQSFEGITVSKPPADAYAMFKEQCEYGGVANKERQKAKRALQLLRAKSTAEATIGSEGQASVAK